MAKSRPKPKQVSLKKIVSSLEKTFSKAEKERETKQKWKNPGARIEQQRQYRADNPEVMNRYNKKRSIKLKIKYATDEKYRQTCRDTGVSNYYRNKKVVHKLLGNKCVCCGENNPIYFNIDHVNNDGHLDKSSVYTLKKYLENPERYQLLCANCNQAKKLNGGKLYKPKKKRKR